MFLNPRYRHEILRILVLPTLQIDQAATCRSCRAKKQMTKSSITSTTKTRALPVRFIEAITSLCPFNDTNVRVKFMVIYKWSNPFNIACCSSMKQFKRKKVAERHLIKSINWNYKGMPLHFRWIIIQYERWSSTRG